MVKKTINDLPAKLVGEKILAKVPITSLREVRSTCKLWERLSKKWIVGKEAARQHQFLGFIIVDSKVCSLRFHLRRKGGEEEEEDSVGVVDLSIKQVNLLNQIEITRVFHCEGLLLCVPLDKSSKLVAWNPYLGQTRLISARTDFHVLDSYHLGYDLNRNHKMLRFLDYKNVLVFEIYDFSSNSWKVLEFRPEWIVEYGHRGVSLKGNAYFLAHDKIVDESDHFLLCFDFTTERFGQRLHLPFHSFEIETLTLSSVRDEKLALLRQIRLTPGRELEIEALEIWITTKTEPNAVAWTKFMKVDMRPLIGDRLVWFDELYGSFFIDEEEKVVVVFDMDGYEFCCELVKTAHYHTAFIIGDDGYYRTLLLGEAPDLYKPPNPGYSGYVPQVYTPPLVCSSAYLPSLIQLGQLRKRKQRHGK